MNSMFIESNVDCFTKVIETTQGLFNIIVFDGYASDSWNGLDEVEAFILLNRVDMGWSLSRLQAFALV